MAKTMLRNIYPALLKHAKNGGIHGDYMVKQFVRSLRGNPLDLYTDLEPNWIDSQGGNWNTSSSISSIARDKKLALWSSQTIASEM